MSKHRRAAKVDENEKAIRDALIKIPGVSVAPGHDDILVGCAGLTLWFEIKNPNEVRKDGKPYNRKRETNRRQKELSENWSGHYQIVSTLDQILRAISVDHMDYESLKEITKDD